jgi:hypothetical protein
MSGSVPHGIEIRQDLKKNWSSMMRSVRIVVGLMFAALSVMPLSLDAQKSVSYRQVVEQASTTTVVSSSVNPSPNNSAVAFAAHVTGVPGSMPTGTVAFSATQESGQVATATLPLDASGNATWTISLPSGQYGITALYSGDTDYLSSVSTTLSQIVEGPPDFTISLPSTMTAVQGASGTALVTVTPIDGFAGTIQLQCTGAPDESSCNFTQNPLTIPASTATSASSVVTTKLTVTTVGTTVTTLGVLGFFLGWSSCSRRKLRYRSTIWIGMALLLTAVTGCIGSVRYVQSNGTPPGYYSLTVVATSGSITHSSTMTLHVVAQ